MEKVGCKFVSDGVDTHKGDYYWKCLACGLVDWTGYGEKPTWCFKERENAVSKRAQQEFCFN